MNIYIVYNETSKLTKIGITEDIERRVAQIENGCGNKIHLVSYANVPHAPEIERFLHATFMCFRGSGEWFMLDGKGIEHLSSLWYTMFSWLVDKGSEDDDPLFTYTIPIVEVGEHRYKILFYDEPDDWKNIKQEMMQRAHDARASEMGANVK